MSDDVSRDEIWKIIRLVKKIIQSEKENKTIQPEFEPYTHWDVTTFSYNDNGISFGKQGTHLAKPVWRLAHTKISELIKSSEEYRKFKDFLEVEYKKEVKQRQLDFFISKIISKYLDNEESSEREIEKIVENYQNVLKDKPQKSGATVQLVGILLHPEIVELSHEIILRKPKKENFVTDIPLYSFHTDFRTADPTAFLDIVMLSRRPNEIQETMMRAVTVLRLFRLGSVKYISYKMHSDSFSNFMGGMTTSGDSGCALENYILKDDLVADLKIFFEKVSPILPPILFGSTTGKVNHTSIAYNRYSDSLLQSDMIERRIANAVMGLEALYFKPTGEQQELQYRLGIRVAKILGKLSYDPIKVKCSIKDAYAIRSIFLHGGHIGNSEKRKFEPRYNGDVKNLLLLILDYLRVSIIVSMTFHSNKDKFIDIIDRALIDDNSGEQLKDILYQAKDILGISKDT
jgi:hypothetical protein